MYVLISLLQTGINFSLILCMFEWNHYFSQWTQTKKKPDTCCCYSGLIISLGRESVTAGFICPSFFLSLSVSLRISHTCGTQTTVKQINSRKPQKAVWAQLDKSHKHYDHRVKDNCRHVEIVWKGLTEGIHILFLSLAGGFDVHQQPGRGSGYATLLADSFPPLKGSTIRM